MDISVLKDLGMMSIKQDMPKTEDSTKGSIFAMIFKSINEEDSDVKKSENASSVINTSEIASQDINLIDDINAENELDLFKDNDEKDLNYEVVMVTLVTLIQKLNEEIVNANFSMQDENGKFTISNDLITKVVEDVQIELASYSVDTEEIRNLVGMATEIILNVANKEGMTFEQVIQDLNSEVSGILETIQDEGQTKLEKILSFIEKINEKGEVDIGSDIKEKDFPSTLEANDKDIIKDSLMIDEGLNTEVISEDAKTQTNNTNQEDNKNENEEQDLSNGESGKRVEVKTYKNPEAEVVKNNFNMKETSVLKTEENMISRNYNMDKLVETISLTKQVSDNFKILVTSGHSELEIKLEPESLGKLSLKVITEQGMMVAKFEAESQKVKEIIETNMNILKRNLEEQGVKVQSLDVSVRQNSGENSSKNFKENTRQKNNPHKNLRTDINKMVHSVEVNTRISNVYKPKTNLKINYTA